MATGEENNNINKVGEPQVANLFQEDVVLPSVREVSGLEDYYALKETLAWTDATANWPNIGETDWVVLYDSAILSSETPTVSIIKGDTTNLTIMSGTNLIFMDSTELTINQVGGVSEIYFDPTKPAQINLKITEGVSALSHVSTQNIDLIETANEDGSRAIGTGAVSVKYETGDTGSVFVNDLILGATKQATPTGTLSRTVVADEVTSQVEPEQKEVDQFPPAETQQSKPPEVTFSWKANVAELAQSEFNTADVSTDEISKKSFHDTETWYDEDVLIDYEATDIVDTYFELSPAENWPKFSENIFSSDTVSVNEIYSQQQPAQITAARFEELQEASGRQIDDLLVMQQWDDLLNEDLMDLFYGD